MGVYIKGMEMPKSCFDCPMLDWDLDYIKCKVTGRHFKVKEEPFRARRVDDCPLISVPEPHGRLIDADDLCHRIDAGKRTISSLPLPDDFIALYEQIGDGMKDELMKCDTIIPEEGDPQ